MMMWTFGFVTGALVVIVIGIVLDHMFCAR